MKTIIKPFLLATVLLIFMSCSSENDIYDTVFEQEPEGEIPPVEEPVAVPAPPVETSEIIYTDIEPDFKGDDQNLSYSLDLNNDQQADYILQYQNYYGWEYIEIFSNPDIDNGIWSVAPWYSNPLPLNSGDLIFNTPDYSYNGGFYDKWAVFTIGDCFAGEPSCFYDWKNKGDRYLGLKFRINDQIHFGWARLQITSPTEWVIKDYAYSETPEVGILAGAKPSTQ